MLLVNSTGRGSADHFNLLSLSRAFFEFQSVGFCFGPVNGERGIAERSTRTLRGAPKVKLTRFSPDPTQIALDHSRVGFRAVFDQLVARFSDSSADVAR